MRGRRACSRGAADRSETTYDRGATGSPRRTTPGTLPASPPAATSARNGRSPAPTTPSGTSSASSASDGHAENPAPPSTMVASGRASRSAATRSRTSPITLCTSRGSARSSSPSIGMQSSSTRSPRPITSADVRRAASTAAASGRSSIRNGSTISHERATPSSAPRTSSRPYGGTGKTRCSGFAWTSRTLGSGNADGQYSRP